MTNEEFAKLKEDLGALDHQMKELQAQYLHETGHYWTPPFRLSPDIF